MKPSKAVELMLGGAVLTEGTMHIRIKDGRYEVNSVTNRIDGGGWLPASDFNYDYLSDESLTIAQPKSVIEQAIERGCRDALTYSIHADTKGYDLRDRVMEEMRRIANLTLDEAKRVLTIDTQHKDYTIVINKRIDALKVKE